MAHLEKNLSRLKGPILISHNVLIVGIGYEIKDVIMITCQICINEAE